MVLDLNNWAFLVRTGPPWASVNVTHRVHSLGDEGFVSEAFEEGKWLEYGIGDLQLLKDEVLPKSL